jgi:hypothetical protein
MNNDGVSLNMTQRAQCVAGKRSTQAAANTFTLQLTRNQCRPATDEKRHTRTVPLMSIVSHFIYAIGIIK